MAALGRPECPVIVSGP